MLRYIQKSDYRKYGLQSAKMLFKRHPLDGWMVLFSLPFLTASDLYSLDLETKSSNFPDAKVGPNSNMQARSKSNHMLRLSVVGYICETT